MGPALIVGDGLQCNRCGKGQLKNQGDCQMLIPYTSLVCISLHMLIPATLPTHSPGPHLQVRFVPCIAPPPQWKRPGAGATPSSAPRVGTAGGGGGLGATARGGGATGVNLGASLASIAAAQQLLLNSTASGPSHLSQAVTPPHSASVLLSGGEANVPGIRCEVIKCPSTQQE